jgi:hypothetical protein
LFGGLLCLAVWLRRRWPVPLAIVACLLGTWSAASAIAGLVLIWTVVAHRRVATILALLPAVFAGAAIFPLVHPDPAVPYAVEVVLGTVITAIVVMSALYVRGRRQLVAMELDRARLAARDREGQVARARSSSAPGSRGRCTTCSGTGSRW